MTGCDNVKNTVADFFASPDTTIAERVPDLQGNTHDFMLEDFNIKEQEDEVLGELEMLAPEVDFIVGVDEIMTETGLSDSTDSRPLVYISTYHNLGTEADGQHTWEAKNVHDIAEMVSYFNDGSSSGIAALKTMADVETVDEYNINRMLRTAYSITHSKSSSNSTVDNSTRENILKEALGIPKNIDEGIPHDIAGWHDSTYYNVNKGVYPLGGDLIGDGYCYNETSATVENAIARCIVQESGTSFPYVDVFSAAISEALNTSDNNYDPRVFRELKENYIVKMTNNDCKLGLSFAQKMEAANNSGAALHIVLYSGHTPVGLNPIETGFSADTGLGVHTFSSEDDSVCKAFSEALGTIYVGMFGSAQTVTLDKTKSVKDWVYKFRKQRLDETIGRTTVTTHSSADLKNTIYVMNYSGSTPVVFVNVAGFYTNRRGKVTCVDTKDSDTALKKVIDTNGIDPNTQLYDNYAAIIASAIIATLGGETTQ